MLGLRYKGWSYRSGSLREAAKGQPLPPLSVGSPTPIGSSGVLWRTQGFSGIPNTAVQAVPHRVPGLFSLGFKALHFRCPSEALVPILGISVNPQGNPVNLVNPVYPGQCSVS